MVYPRLCGGTQATQRSSLSMKGLSPPVRGNRNIGRPGIPAPWSIPACAGEPLGHWPGEDVCQVYPRLCGGTCRLPAGRGTIRGLSPPVRGNRSARFRGATHRRSIPACAGEPDPAAAARNPMGVYPRLCGGTAFKVLQSRLEPGLSPPVRGNRSRVYYSTDLLGSIPACAGEPVPADLTAGDY